MGDLMLFPGEQKVKVLVAQLCLTLCNSELCPPGSSAHEILQARILEWVADVGELLDLAGKKTKLDHDWQMWGLARKSAWLQQRVRGTGVKGGQGDSGRLNHDCFVGQWKDWPCALRDRGVASYDLCVDNKTKGMLRTSLAVQWLRL